MSAAVSEIVRSWSSTERWAALREIIQEITPADGAPLAIDEIGYFMPQAGDACSVKFDEGTPYLREMRRRAETPEDSDLILEIDLPHPDDQEDRES